MIAIICLVLVLVVNSECHIVEKNNKIYHNCGYESCHWTNSNPDVINVHLLPHSHDDVGWLKTVDQYYYGLRTYVQFAGVQHIIGSVVEALQVDPDRRFIQVETAFFWEWWKQQSAFKRDVVRKLVNSGQLVMVNGAWSMNDEATTNYQSTIDQFTLGLRRISETVGDCGRPNIGWQIDPFGHSGEMASIFAQLGYEAVFFARLDWRDSALRHSTKNLEFLWQGSQNLGPKSNLFTSILYDFYTAPRGFCWDVVCGDTPIVDNIESPDYNQHYIVNRFADYVYNASRFFRSNNVLITMGGDFTYQAAGMYFTNMDKLIDGFKKFKKDIHIFYSTPACYLKSVNEASKRGNLKYTVKYDDFFPYASDAHAYWTGYFTSRPNSKRFERQGNNLLQVLKQLNALSRFNEDYSKDFEKLHEVMGIMQHHDAITGTAKQHVADDYVRLLSKAMKEATKNIGTIVTTLLDKRPGQYMSNVRISLTQCLLANVSQCVESTKSRFVVVLYNPLSRSQTFFVRLPVDSENFAITGPSGLVSYDIAPPISNFSDIPTTLNTSDFELVFKAQKIPPLGIHYYIVERTNALSKHKFTRRQQSDRQTRFGNSYAGFEVDPATGLLKSVNLRGYSIPVKQEFLYYIGASGYDSDNRASGAYIFKPDKDFPRAIPFARVVNWKSCERGEFDEVHQEFNGWIKQIIRVYKDGSSVEFDWLVGPMALTNQSIEVITRFTTNLNNGNTFYTDSNGREMIKRIRNYRETYNYTNDEPVSGNYYPITSRIMIEDTGRDMQFAVLNDRAQGGSSLQNGEVELMVHRRLLNDDNFGVGEALNEYENGKPVAVRGKHYLTFGRIRPTHTDKHPSAFHRLLAQEKLLSPWVFLGDISDPYYNVKSIQDKIHFQFSGLHETLPENIQILTLEPWTNDTVLLRLEHIIEYYDHEYLSNEVTINLENLFKTFRVVDFVETTLGANQKLDDKVKLQWNTTSQEYPYLRFAKRSSNNNKWFEVTLYPMEIKTFILDIERY